MNIKEIASKKAQEWLDAEGMPSEKEIAELEKTYQDWIKEIFSQQGSQESDEFDPYWDETEESLIEQDLDEYKQWIVESEDPLTDEDLYTDLDPDWNEYWETGRLY